MALASIRSACVKYAFSNNSVQKSVRCLSSVERSCEYDVVVVGGGIVGVATAREILLRHPKLQIAIVEKEPELARHQSSHNSGVIHAGIYYKPGSLKAKLCGEGLKLCYQYCDEKKIPYKKVGKIIVATDAKQVEGLKVLQERGIQNNVPDLQLLEGKQIQEIEPYCRGLKALWSPHTGIVDYKLVTQSYSKDFQNCGGNIHLNFEVNKFESADSADYPVIVKAKNGQFVKTKYVFTCGGLYSDKLAEMSDCSKEPQIIPFRGEYLLLHPSKNHMIKGNIYPVPDPRFPFLGVHFTPRMDGSVILGPNAVLALKREGYTWTDINVGELYETLKYSGFRKMALKYVVPGSKEMLKSLITPLQMKDLQKYIPEITAKDVSRGPAGVRAQAMSANGDLVDDFVFDMGTSSVGKRILHCRNAPSPAATSSLAIAKMLADKVKEEFGLA